MKASEIMTPEVITVSPDTSVADLARTMMENRISGVPVVQNGRLVGIVSEGDLLRRIEMGTERRRSRWLEFFTSGATLAEDYVKSHGKRASDVMTEDVITIDVDTPVPGIADTMESRHIKRLPVLQGEKLVGMVSRANLIQALASRATEPAKSSRIDDEAIREAVWQEISAQPWMSSLLHTNVIVSDGVVHLWGFVWNDEERKAIVVAARNIPGVKDVEDHLEFHIVGHPPIYNVIGV